ncbi:MAG TPA: Calx-beta domain-containing protein, partial [Pyrinomonadaceae bacterium]|nr:Calx-beta domain-containing protein [Pyrinomonadaceae bacterium]
TATPTPTPATVQFGQSLYTIFEDCTGVTITVTRTGDTSQAATVDYATQSGTASDRSDFDTAMGSLSFAPGETAKSFDVLITEDSYTEGTESFTIALSNPAGATLGSQKSVNVQIFDDSPETATNPIDSADDFVCQHYHDFLNREEDSAGGAFWTNEIMSCGSNAACVLQKRINTSGAFFLSNEFQETGGFAIRIQRAAFARKSVDPATRITYAQFIRDGRLLGDQVVVGQTGWEARLENNKQFYVNQVAASTAFTVGYASGLTADQFVDALFAAAAVTPTAAERQAAINAFGSGGPAGRAAALRSVADSNSLRTAELRPSFVLMQYFGYLRRNPTDAPDNNDNGYQFWLAKLNAFNGDFVQAEMVRAFITAGEYRSRFGQP